MDSRGIKTRNMKHVSGSEVLKKIEQPKALTPAELDSILREEADAKAAGVGYLARGLVQATMPHSKPDNFYFERRNGNYTLSMMGHPRIGLPYGIVPRMVMIWLSTEAVLKQEVIKQSRELILGDSLSAFMQELGMAPTGGKWGSITRLREQTHKLFTSAVSCLYMEKANFEHSRIVAETGFRIADEHQLFWDPKRPDQRGLFSNRVKLSEMFFKELLDSPVILNRNALKALPRSPMAIDIFVWLSYRMSYLHTKTTISWPMLQAQFGAEYKETRDFKANFLKRLKEVLAIYTAARVEVSETGLVLKPSSTFVPKLPPAKDHA
jgi:hypothetical protein